ncbi:DUF5683 domain-containing protein [Dyadobacter sandarakinus]|uniref:DUF5683 domain-containing protein n=1 Tax=Dyadobacter sandarakinus TaxID=2747268 RepID=A0ABX7I134_9BACT|nr:DUF5683 domain-containing protein [Dyadobacter sandarakinus]QRQ99599.1 hypothetical protein HWI92_01060 [Dyadobacter sandarakinus]
MKNWLWIGLILLSGQHIMGQVKTADSVRVATAPAIADTTQRAAIDSIAGKKKKFAPVPRRATRLALIPGGGQLYNRDYWKAPIVYLAFGGGLYAYYLNSVKYKDYLATYKAFYDLDKNSPNYGKIKEGLTADSTLPVRYRNLFNTSSTYPEINRDQAARGKNYWRRNRGFALIVSGLIYSLTIIEANVAAHMKTFDLSDDLTLRLEPKLNQPAMRSATPGVRLVFNFK